MTEHRVVTLPIVPGLHVAFKVLERLGQVATAIVPPKLREYEGRHGKITAAGLRSLVNFLKTFGSHREADPADCPFLLAGCRPPTQPALGW